MLYVQITRLKIGVKKMEKPFNEYTRELRQLRTTVEIKIQKLLQEELNNFTEETGVKISSVNIDLIPLCEIGRIPKIVPEVSIYLSL